MKNNLDAALIKRYHSHGYLAPLNVFSQDEVLQLNVQLGEFQKRIGGQLAGRFNQKSHLLCPWINQLVRDPRILDCVESLLGPNLMCWGSQFFSKNAHDPAYVGWHQDGNYWGLSSNEVLTAWIAFTPSTLKSGCMMVVPGTHHQVVEHEDLFIEHNMLSRGQEIAVRVKDQDKVPLELQPGQMSLHHVLIHHGSEPNQSDFPRTGFAIRYIPTHIRQLGEIKGSALLVRGHDDFGHFILETDPSGDFDEAATIQHQQVLDQQLKILYAGSKQAGKLNALLNKPTSP